MGPVFSYLQPDVLPVGCATISADLPREFLFDQAFSVHELGEFVYVHARDFSRGPCLMRRLQSGLVDKSTSHATYTHQIIRNAVDIPPLKDQRPLHDIPVKARIEWQHDGEEYLHTIAYAWTPGIILVEILDHRLPVHGEWLPIQDVERLG